jgi:CRISPR type IV-associated protein Csf3
VSINMFIVSQPDHQPLRIVADLVEPVVYVGDLLHIDGVLAGGAYNAMTPEQQAELPSMTTDWALDLDLPLARWLVPVSETWQGHRGLLTDEYGYHTGQHRVAIWGWAASAEMLPWMGYGRHAVRKRPPLEQLVRHSRDASAQLGAGPMKAYDLSLPTLIAPRMEWHALGNRDKVAELLSHVRAIGKKRNTGNGRVRSWTVEVMAEEDCHPIARHGACTRRMPVESGLDGAKAWGSIRPPYHHHSRMCEALRPPAPAGT